MSRKTVKELNKDFEILKENFDMLRSDFEERINALKIDHEEQIKILNDKISSSADLQGPGISETQSSTALKCRECGFSFDKRSDLKIHILALHPRQFTCKMCSRIFETRISLELHQKEHSTGKNFKCDLCDQTFFTKWRLGKHVKQHEMTSIRFCHFFNNDKFCKYEELGCMFKHNDAPVCKNGTWCRSKMCQFKHTTTEETFREQLNENPTEEEVDALPVGYTCDVCGFVSKTEYYLSVHRRSKHMPTDCIIDNLGDNQDDDSDDDAEDDDGPMECNHCGINGVEPVFVTEDFEILLQHIWNDHKENSAWGPAH